MTATITISTLPQTATVQDNSFLPIETNNVTQKITGAALKSYISSLPEVTAETGAFTGAISAESAFIAANLSVGGTVSAGSITTGLLNATTVNATNINIDGLGAFTGNVTAPNFIAAQGVEAVSLKGTITTALQPNIIGVGNLQGLSVTGAINTVGSITATGTITSSGAGGFASASSVSNVRNPIWRFANADAFGISYFQGNAGVNSQDSIGFHFGTATSAGSNVSITRSGTVIASGFVGNASSATKLATARTINGVAFDGTQDIDLGLGVSNAADLQGTTLASNVVGSSLRSVGTLNNLSIAGAIVPTSNVTVDIGSTTNWFRTIYGTSVQAQYADLAEVYASDATYAPGTVLVFGGTSEVTLSTRANDRTVAGVVTTHPAYLMNAHAVGAAVALQGRVPCRVTGEVKLGDMMVTSDIPGVAMASDEPKLGSVIGKALASHTGLEVGVIEVAVGRL